MNEQKCIWCEKAMGNSLNTIRHGKERNRYPIHKHCYEDNSIIQIYKKIEDSIEEIIKKCDGFCYTKDCFHRNKENNVCPKCQNKIDSLTLKKDGATQ